MAKEQVSIYKERLLQELEEVAAIIVDINSNLDDLTSLVTEDGKLSNSLKNVDHSLDQLFTAFKKVPILQEIKAQENENRNN